MPKKSAAFSQSLYKRLAIEESEEEQIDLGDWSEIANMADSYWDEIEEEANKPLTGTFTALSGSHTNENPPLAHNSPPVADMDDVPAHNDTLDIGEATYTDEWENVENNDDYLLNCPKILELPVQSMIYSTRFIDKLKVQIMRDFDEENDRPLRRWAILVTRDWNDVILHCSLCATKQLFLDKNVHDVLIEGTEVACRHSALVSKFAEIGKPVEESLHETDGNWQRIHHSTLYDLDKVIVFWYNESKRCMQYGYADPLNDSPVQCRTCTRSSRCKCAHQREMTDVCEVYLNLIADDVLGGEQVAPNVEELDEDELQFIIGENTDPFENMMAQLIISPSVFPHPEAPEMRQVYELIGKRVGYQNFPTVMGLREWSDCVAVKPDGTRCNGRNIPEIEFPVLVIHTPHPVTNVTIYNHRCDQCNKITLWDTGEMAIIREKNGRYFTYEFIMSYLGAYQHSSIAISAHWKACVNSWQTMYSTIVPAAGGTVPRNGDKRRVGDIDLAPSREHFQRAILGLLLVMDLDKNFHACPLEESGVGYDGIHMDTRRKFANTVASYDWEDDNAIPVVGSHSSQRSFFPSAFQSRKLLLRDYCRGGLSRERFRELRGCTWHVLNPILQMEPMYV